MGRLLTTIRFYLGIFSDGIDALVGNAEDSFRFAALNVFSCVDF
ncbi:hypothetical protein [Teredinibacter waterburyi]|nr:hypothetical protein [Teredinibacter waterburyi]